MFPVYSSELLFDMRQYLLCLFPFVRNFYNNRFPVIDPQTCCCFHTTSLLMWDRLTFPSVIWNLP